MINDKLRHRILFWAAIITFVFALVRCEPLREYISLKIHFRQLEMHELKPDSLFDPHSEMFKELSIISEN